MTDDALRRDDIVLLQLACVLARERVRVAEEMLALARWQRRAEERRGRRERRRREWWTLADELPTWLFGIAPR